MTGARQRARGRAARARRERAARRRELLEYVGLAALADRPAAGLPFGTLKRIELARALAARPRLLLLDEPAGGLNHEEVGELGRFIQQLRTDFDATVLLVEHHMNLVMGDLRPRARPRLRSADRRRHAGGRSSATRR